MIDEVLVMISDIVLTGYAGDMINDKFRYIETNHHDAFTPHIEIVSKIPVLYWTRESNNPITFCKKGAYVVIRGHIESDEQMGLFVLAEAVQLTK